VQGFSDKVASTNPAVAGLDTGDGPALYGAPNVQIASFDQIAVTPASGRNDITAQISDIVSWSIGKHELRVGLEYRRTYIDVYYYFGGRGIFVFTGTEGPWNQSNPANRITRRFRVLIQTSFRSRTTLPPTTTPRPSSRAIRSGSFIRTRAADLCRTRGS
jgi:hypothetical protein